MCEIYVWSCVTATVTDSLVRYKLLVCIYTTGIILFCTVRTLGMYVGLGRGDRRLFVAVCHCIVRGYCAWHIVMLGLTCGRIVCLKSSSSHQWDRTTIDYPFQHNYTSSHPLPLLYPYSSSPSLPSPSPSSTPSACHTMDWEGRVWKSSLACY